MTYNERMATPLVLLGLGNPGARYEMTRHNAGRMFLCRVAAVHAFAAWRYEKSLCAWCTEGEIDSCAATLVLPDTYMNRSGETLSALLRTYDVAPSRVVACYDDIDLPFGTVRLSARGGAGGHNGVQSLLHHTPTDEFARVRFGIQPQGPFGRAYRPVGAALERHVLGRVTRREYEKLSAAFTRAESALTTLCTRGIEAAMNECNRPAAPAPRTA